MARILVYTSPERGHLYPLVPTLIEPRSRGHDVRVLTMSGAGGHAARAGCRGCSG